jgi:fructose-specific phosphotransferase system IIC component
LTYLVRLVGRRFVGLVVLGFVAGRVIRLLLVWLTGTGLACVLRLLVVALFRWFALGLALCVILGASLSHALANIARVFLGRVVLGIVITGVVLAFVLAMRLMRLSVVIFIVSRTVSEVLCEDEV